MARELNHGSYTIMVYDLKQMMPNASNVLGLQLGMPSKNGRGELWDIGSKGGGGTSKIPNSYQ